MKPAKSSLIITAATIGSGVFALPYVIAQAGWLLALAYYVILGAMVTAAHAAYLATLAQEKEKQRLLGLMRRYFGRTGFWFGFAGIVVGLLLSFVIFLILGTQFIQILAPSIHRYAALAIMWLLIAIPALASNRRATALEMISVISVGAVMIFLGASSLAAPVGRATSIPAVNWHAFFLPFGIVLFTLAGWTGVEPFYESQKGKMLSWRGIATGTAIAIALYGIFAAGILRTVPHVTPSILSDLSSWPIWKKDILAVIGLFALTTVAMPISHELRNALEKDLRWPISASRIAIIGVPLAVVLMGVTNFVSVIGVAGSIFISMQYLSIIAVARRALALPAIQRLLLDIASIAFLAAAVYEVALFVIQ